MTPEEKAAHKAKFAAKMDEMRLWFSDRSDLSLCRGRVKLHLRSHAGSADTQCSRAPIKGETFCWQHKKRKAP